MISREELLLRALVTAVVQNNRSKICDILAEDITDLNLKTSDGWTPLMFAASRGHRDIVFKLVQYGADIWLLNRKNEDAAYIAERKGFDDIAAFLRSME